MVPLMLSTPQTVIQLPETHARIVLSQPRQRCDDRAIPCPPIYQRAIPGRPRQSNRGTSSPGRQPVFIYQISDHLSLLGRPQSFFDHILQRIRLHGFVRVHSFELGALCLQLLDPLQLGSSQPAVLRLPLVVRRRPDAMFATNLCYRQTSIRFLQNRNNLRLAKP